MQLLCFERAVALRSLFLESPVVRPKNSVEFSLRSMLEIVKNGHKKIQLPSSSVTRTGHDVEDLARSNELRLTNSTASCARTNDQNFPFHHLPPTPYGCNAPMPTFSGLALFVSLGRERSGRSDETQGGLLTLDTEFSGSVYAFSCPCLSETLQA